MMISTMMLMLGTISASAQQNGDVATSTVGRVGQRQTGADNTGNIVPTARIISRIENRIDSRLRTRIQTGSNTQEDAATKINAAASQARITRR